jgi:PTS system nitrogen regulatory IIA component
MRLNINEMARRLKLPSSTIERWIRQGRIPMQKSGRDCIFEAVVLEKWARTHHLSFTASSNALLENKVRDTFPAEGGSLSVAMQHGGIYYHTPGDDVTTVLTAVVEQLPQLSPPNQKELLEKLLEREHLASTGIGKGVAIPHPRSPMPKIVSIPSVSTCFLARPVDFAAIDDQPVQILFLLLSPDVKTHLHLLSRLSFCMRDDAFVAFLQSIPARDVFFDNIKVFEKQLDQAERSRS